MIRVYFCVELGNFLKKQRLWERKSIGRRRTKKINADTLELVKCIEVVSGNAMKLAHGKNLSNKLALLCLCQFARIEMYTFHWRRIIFYWSPIASNWCYPNTAIHMEYLAPFLLSLILIHLQLVLFVVWIFISFHFVFPPGEPLLLFNSLHRSLDIYENVYSS